jgi:hypothetical protein
MDVRTRYWDLEFAGVGESGQFRARHRPEWKRKRLNRQHEWIAGERLNRQWLDREHERIAGKRQRHRHRKQYRDGHRHGYGIADRQRFSGHEQ